MFGKIWIQNVGNIDLKMIYATKNSNKFQKTRFCKERSVENVVTLEGLPKNSSMISFHIWLFKKSIHTLQNNVHMLSFPILSWVHTWANGTCHTNLSMKEGSLLGPAPTGTITLDPTFGSFILL